MMDIDFPHMFIVFSICFTVCVAVWIMNVPPEAFLTEHQFEVYKYRIDQENE